jgi:hypothetical protein
MNPNFAENFFTLMGIAKTLTDDVIDAFCSGKRVLLDVTPNAPPS